MEQNKVMKAFKGLRKLLDARSKRHIDWISEDNTTLFLSNQKDRDQVIAVLPEGLTMREVGQDHLTIMREDGRVFSFEQLEALGF